LQAATIDRAPVVQLDLSCAESRKKAAYAIGKAAHPSFLAQAVRNNLSSTESTKAMHDAMQHTATELLEDQVQPEYMAFNAGLLFGGAGFNVRHQKQQASCLLTANGAASRAAMHGEGKPYTDVWQASNGAQLNRTTHSANAQLLHHHIGVTSGRSFEDRRKNSEAKARFRDKYEEGDVGIIEAGVMRPVASRRELVPVAEPAAVRQGPVGGELVPAHAPVRVVTSAETTAYLLVEISGRMRYTEGDPGRPMSLLSDNVQDQFQTTSRASLEKAYSVDVKTLRVTLVYEPVWWDGVLIHQVDIDELEDPDYDGFIGEPSAADETIRCREIDLDFEDVSDRELRRCKDGHGDKTGPQYRAWLLAEYAPEQGEGGMFAESAGRVGIFDMENNRHHDEWTPEEIGLQRRTNLRETFQHINNGGTVSGAVTRMAAQCHLNKASATKETDWKKLNSHASVDMRIRTLLELVRWECEELEIQPGEYEALPSGWAVGRTDAMRKEKAKYIVDGGRLSKFTMDVRERDFNALNNARGELERRKQKREGTQKQAERLMNRRLAVPVTHGRRGGGGRGSGGGRKRGREGRPADGTATVTGAKHNGGRDESLDGWEFSYRLDTAASDNTEPLTHALLKACMLPE
jgi:hypothetical protein